MKLKLNYGTWSDVFPSFIKFASTGRMKIEYRNENELLLFKKTFKSVHHYDIYYSKLELLNK